MHQCHVYIQMLWMFACLLKLLQYHYKCALDRLKHEILQIHSCTLAKYNAAEQVYA